MAKNIRELRELLGSMIGDDALADQVVREFLRYFGGVACYFPAQDFQTRNREIADLHAAGMPVDAIAKRFRLHAKTVYRILHAQKKPGQ